MAGQGKPGPVVAVVSKVALGLVFAVAVVLLMLWLAGAFHTKIDAGAAFTEEHAATGRPAGR